MTLSVVASSKNCPSSESKIREIRSVNWSGDCQFTCELHVNNGLVVVIGIQLLCQSGRKLEPEFWFFARQSFLVGVFHGSFDVFVKSLKIGKVGSWLLVYQWHEAIPENSKSI